MTSTSTSTPASTSTSPSPTRGATAPVVNTQAGHADMVTPSAYVEREQFILERCRGKRVLHLGCIGLEYCDTSTRVQTFQQSLHWRLSEIAEVTGVDISAGAVEELKRLGLAKNIVVGDVQALDELQSDGVLQGRFDYVVAGDIIEHITSPGHMLEGLRGLLEPDGELIITTPNAFGLPRFLRFFAGRFRENDEHVMCFNFQNMANMLARHGYTLRTSMTCCQNRARAMGWRFRLGKKLLEWMPRWGGTILVAATLAVLADRDSGTDQD